MLWIFSNRNSRRHHGRFPENLQRIRSKRASSFFRRDSSENAFDEKARRCVFGILQKGENARNDAADHLDFAASKTIFFGWSDRDRRFKRNAFFKINRQPVEYSWIHNVNKKNGDAIFIPFARTYQTLDFVEFESSAPISSAASEFNSFPRFLQIWRKLQFRDTDWVFFYSFLSSSLGTKYGNIWSAISTALSAP